MSQVPPLPRILSFSQPKGALFPPHSVSPAESRNLCVVVAVAGLCPVRRPRHPLLQLSPLTHLQGSRMRKGTLLFLLSSWRRLINLFSLCSGGKFPTCRAAFPLTIYADSFRLQPSARHGFSSLDHERLVLSAPFLF